jgi:hypothetical protein
MAPVKPQVPTSILQGGSSLGWFTPPSGAPTPSKYDEIIDAGKKAKAAGLNVGDLGSVFQLTSLFPQQSWDQEKQKLDYIAQQKREEADYRQKLGEESTKKALLYSSLGNLGNQIATGIGGTPEQWKQMYNIPSVYNETLRSFPTTAITPSATSAIGQRDYFR